MTAVHVYLTLAAFLFCLGVFMVVTRRNGIMALIGIELMMNAANLNFVAFSTLFPEKASGHMAVLFILVVAACEVAVALAILLNAYKLFKTVEMDEINEMRS